MMGALRIACPDRTRFLKRQLLCRERELCSERALLITEAYQEFASDPMIVKRAKALRKILKGMSVYILDQELIVGHQASKQRSVPVFPEYDVEWLERELDILETRPQDQFRVPQEVRRDLQAIFPYWRDRGIRRVLFNSLPVETREHRLESKVFAIAAHEETALGHVLLDYERVITEGFEGIKAEIGTRMATLKTHIPEDMERYLFYRAAWIACDAAIEFANRYADLATGMAEQESEPNRKRELERIAAVCRQVPSKPARDFWEALQALWFVQLIPQIENNASSYSPGRMDRYLYPLYERDLECGKLTRSKAQELLDCLWLKFSEPLLLYNTEAARFAGGFPMGQNVTVGGVDRQGRDSTNELSYLCLNAQEHIRLGQPNFTVRVHHHSPTEFLVRAAEVIAQGGGMPQLMNDGICIPALLNAGMTVQEARDYAPVGCVEINVVGGWGRENGGYLNLGKVLEYVLNNGVCRMTGKQAGLALGSLSDYGSFDELMAAFKAQLRHFIPHVIVENNMIDRIHAQYVPSPIVSVLVPGCIEKGMEVTAGGARHNFTGPTAVGGANVGNSLAAIKRLVFDEEILRAETLEEALEANFEDYEDVRGLLRERAPKYGNDVDYVDDLVKEVVETFADELEKYTNFRGGIFRPGLTAVTAHIGMGEDVGATPDGRLSGSALASGISPVPGTDRSGPTASARSVAKVDLTRFGKGMIFNQTFSPFVFGPGETIGKFVDYIRGCFDSGGMHVQFNVISRETLRQAQAEPEKYGTLLVRVAGYSALFVDLSRDVQDQIMARTEHSV
jgi:pyruvate formate-lyase/glycerol dehydratase family glycyl radical enzyme